MADDTEKLPMDEVTPENPPATQEEAKPERQRDDSGRFAPKQDEGKGHPDADAARRRERNERDHWKKEAEATKAAHDALQKRLDDMASFMKGEEPKEENADPLKPVMEKLDGIQQRFQKDDEAKQAEEIDRQVRAYADADEARFTAQTPDFPNAVQHYIVSRMQDLEAMGIGQQQAEGILTQEAQQLLYTCAQQGRSPAETIYAMARNRGFSGQVIEHRPNNVTQMPNAGGRSLGTGGGPAGGAMTAAQIASMDEADYNAFRSTPEGKRAIKRAMGG